MNSTLRTLILFCPLTSIGLLIQSLLGWFAPQYELGHTFLKNVGPLFMMEFIFMHSGIFYEMRKAMFKNVWGQRSVALVLFAIYGLALAEFITDYPWIGWNYLILNFSRFIEKEETTAAGKSKFLRQLGAYDDAWIMALLKAGGVILGLPLLVFLVPLPTGALTIENIRILVPEHSDPDSVALLTKAMALYFGILTALDLRNARKTVVIWITKRNAAKLMIPTAS